MNNFRSGKYSDHIFKQFKGFKEYVDDFNYEIIEQEVLEDEIFVYNIEVEGNIDVSTCIKKFMKMIESEKFEEDALLLIECKGSLIFLTQGLTFEEINSKCIIENTNVPSFLKKKLKEKEAFQKRINQANLQNMMFNPANKKDSLIGFKQRIAGGNSDVMRILNRLISFIGQKKAESYIKVLDKEQITTAEMYDAMINDSLGNVATLSTLVKNRDSSLFVTDEEEEKIKQKKQFKNLIQDSEFEEV